jgi:hypothetical protein
MDPYGIISKKAGIRWWPDGENSALRNEGGQITAVSQVQLYDCPR